MEKETTIVSSINNKCKNKNVCGTPGTIYGLGFIGALVYFIQHADNFWVGALGVLKAITWPAFLIYKLFEFFKF
ncbi:MAG: hypothetical protein WC694_00470 [Candidatus Paceibacterota bacterium]|jgi:hypothetical protein